MTSVGRSELEAQVSAIVSLLVAKDYEEIERVTQGVRLSSDEIRSAIETYGRTLMTPPGTVYALMDVIEVVATRPPRWSIAMPLWTEEEGRSDLTLELTLIRSDDKFDIELDDIHVL